MFGRKLACSFCRRTEDRVSKLVAGPRVYICDRCATEVIRIMNDSERRLAAGVVDCRPGKASTLVASLVHWSE